ncbi:MAG: UDP-N-acetylmuramoyl-L-alanyl-D-glutamate--2,6-diaminopimelate ligase [Proteobacteria bacterium]|nr:UDP-N-acetylmuramoyl-L-alanyl-D-glutamate--2,6-diaminopimelate ligase [Pseudomonadota bacterium]
MPGARRGETNAPTDLFARLAEQGAVIRSLSSDSRRCTPGVAFFAYPGETVDGRGFIDDAIGRGAAAVLWESEAWHWPPARRLPNVGVPGLRDAAGFLADAFHAHPSAALWTCGVTGTNGKTSCVHWIAAALERANAKAGVVGTLGSGRFGALEAGPNTTPDALALHDMLDTLRRGGAQAVAMEVSSHGLLQGRVNGVAFDCALFTNLSHDHLDYHGSMEAYAAAKARLFDMPGLRTAVLNLDDVVGVRIAQAHAGRGLRIIGYALSEAAVVPGGTDAFIAVRALQLEGDAMRAQLVSSWGEAELRFGQLGRFNLSNALGVLGCLIDYGFGFHEAVAQLAELPSVPGRMQRLGGGAQAPLVVVDYAHSPDALEKVLQSLRPLAEARGGTLGVVFGAGGERDAAKRPLMGAVAARLADRIVLTSDNPRGEAPLGILEAIRTGVAGACTLELDRARAITGAITQANAADVILVAGKGHEAWQERDGTRVPFSDVAVARAALDRRTAR